MVLFLLLHFIEEFLIRPWWNDFVLNGRARISFLTHRVAHASLFQHTAFLIKLACKAFFVSLVSFYEQTLLATFYLIPRHLSFNSAMWGPLINQSQLSIHILTLQSHSFTPVVYICQCNNWYKLKITWTRDFVNLLWP